MRLSHQGKRAMSLEARYHPDGAAVDATGIWHEGHAAYLGRSVVSPLATDVLLPLRSVGTRRQKSADAIVAEPIGEGLNIQCRMENDGSMTIEDADNGIEISHTQAEGSGRKSHVDALGGSSVTVSASNSQPEATMQLMEYIVSRENMMAALHRVVSNKGAAGIDKMSVSQLKPYLVKHWLHIKEELLTDRYEPAAVRGVEIPKPGGGKRLLGIPTVLDRLIQQAMHQVLMPIFDPDFSNSSYGFRPERSAHNAVLAARSYVTDGYRVVVDLDLEKFFDRVNHDVLLARVARKVKDKQVLRLIRCYLQAGLMMGGIMTVRSEGTPQGGPLSPLLSNILLDDLDKELERRGHRFCRYADDCNIYVQSMRAGHRVMASLTVFLEKRLKLKVNTAKSAVDHPWNRVFLGYTMSSHQMPRLRVAVSSEKRFMAKLRTQFRVGRGRSLETTIKDLAPILRGWTAYYRLADVKGTFGNLDGWIRRRLRCILWRQWKQSRTRIKQLMQRGIDKMCACMTACNSHGPWRNAKSDTMHRAFRNRFFEEIGLISTLDEHRRLNHAA